LEGEVIPKYMSLFNFFRGKKTDVQHIRNNPSQEQLEFYDAALQILTPLLTENGFKLTRTEIEEYSTTITFRKATQYIKIKSNTSPRDYPNYYNVMLGDGDSEDFTEYDWNAIALWRLKEKIAPAAKAKEYAFPRGNKIPYSLTNARDELIKYAGTFLKGDLTDFIATRKKLTQAREPYKIYTPDDEGNYTVSYDPRSLEMKKKYGEQEGEP
jgi:hypothetical protein